MAGFGGLLAMMAFAEIDGARALRQIQQVNDEIREDFVLRTRLLERIRGDVYVSGTSPSFVRHFHPDTWGAMQSLADQSSARARGIAMDMMDNARALPTCPQRQQQQQTADRNMLKFTHTTAR